MFESEGTTGKIEQNVYFQLYFSVEIFVADKLNTAAHAFMASQKLSLKFFKLAACCNINRKGTTFMMQHTG